jgi:hypothetical protein
MGRPGAEETAQFATLPQTQLWVAVSAALTGLSLAAGLIVVRPWWHLFSDADTLARTVSVLVLIAALLAVFLPRAMVRPRMELPYRFRTVVPFLVFGGLGFFPPGSGMILLWAAALEADSGSLAAARRSVGALVEQRRSLMLFLGMASFIVFLAVLSQAALRRALIIARRDYPPIFLALTGAYFSTLIALLFVPAYLAMQEAAQAAVDTLVPLSDATFPNHEWFERQSDLRAFLGLDVSIVGLFSAAFAVLIPVASSVLAAYLSIPGGKKEDGHGGPD